MTDAEREHGIVRESILIASNDFQIWGEDERLHGLDRFSCWLNGWLPGGWRVGRVNGRRRVFRPTMNRRRRP